MSRPPTGAAASARGRPRLAAVLPAVAYGGALVAQAFLVPPGVLRLVPSGTDLALHGAAYAVLGALLVRAAVVGLGLAPATWPAMAALSTLAGGADEWLQSRVPGRTASGLDLLADLAGSVLGAFAMAAWLRRRAPPTGAAGAAGAAE